MWLRVAPRLVLRRRSGDFVVNQLCEGIVVNIGGDEMRRRR